MLCRGNPHRDDHRRLPRHGPSHRATDRSGTSRHRRNRSGARRHDRRAAAGACWASQYLRARCPRAEVAAGAGVQGQWRNRRDDRRRGQRRPRVESGTYRRRHGQARIRCGARSRVAGVARRRFRVHGGSSQARAPHLRQYSEGDVLHHRRARADRGNVTTAIAFRLAVGVLSGAHRVSRICDRSGMFDRVRGRTSGARRDAPAAARRDFAAVQRLDRLPPASCRG